MNSNERRLKILYMLQSGKRITTRFLMEQFGISKRTVYRDLRVIQDLGVPVTHHPEWGYGVMRDGMIPPIMFSFRELSVIIVGLSFVRSQIDEEMVRDAENVLLKIRNAIPVSMHSAMNTLEEKMLVSPFIDNVNLRDRGGDWFILCSAFSEKKPVSFYYTDRQGNRSLRRIDPQLLIYYTDHWNVIGYCHDRHALRNFMLSGMEDLQLGDSPLLTREDYSKRELLYGRSDKTETVMIHVNNEKLFSFLRELPGELQDKKILKDTTLVSFSIDNLDFINEWLLQFADHIRIHSPEKLKGMRIELLKQLQEKTR